jgi:hypothetical protein
MGANNSVPANYSAAAYTVLTIDIILTTSAVVGRTVSRRVMKATPATDDYLCYFAYVSAFDTVFQLKLMFTDCQPWSAHIWLPPKCFRSLGPCRCLESK